jgi:hypothetical protein
MIDAKTNGNASALSITNFKLPEPTRLFPVIPDITQSKPKHHTENDSAKVIPSVGNSITSVNKQSSALVSEPAVTVNSGSSLTQYKRNSRVPTLPMVLKPLTVTDHKSTENRSNNKELKTEKNHKDSPGTKPETRFERRATPRDLPNYAVSPPVSASQVEPVSEPIAKPVILEEVKIPAPTAPVRPVEALKTASPAPRPNAKPPENRGSTTFQSPSGLRTTATLPKLAPKTASGLIPKNAPTADSQPKAQSGMEDPGRVRTSVDMFRKQHAKSNGVEEWR